MSVSVQCNAMPRAGLIEITMTDRGLLMFVAAV